MLNIFKLLPRKVIDLEARLTGVNGFTGRGAVGFSVWRDGARVLGVGLRGLAGRVAEIYVDGSQACVVELANGRADRRFATRRGDAVPEMTEGAQVDIRQNGDIVLEGVLVPN